MGSNIRTHSFSSCTKKSIKESISSDIYLVQLKKKFYVYNNVTYEYIAYIKILNSSFSFIPFLKKQNPTEATIQMFFFSIVFLLSTS